MARKRTFPAAEKTLGALSAFGAASLSEIFLPRVLFSRSEYSVFIVFKNTAPNNFPTRAIYLFIIPRAEKNVILNRLAKN